MIFQDYIHLCFNSFDTAGLNLGPTDPMTQFIISEKYTNTNNAANGKIYT